ncbi:hypothetical protein [Francisella adeliensis]|uniref:Uncharacterized protein n=1 Tax=Francisella adeliensis TaxID=2007306 RepID=A0ABX6KAF1_9GAMM|nr:hypothetical protein [Francisella adeliensis]MBK2085937.1 hypothetical protein [Francisella adeliensis]MBK2096899.1 hypothetical protein [Francisella adeliensis]QIW11399.1 hypothetical protein FZC43_01485 [Francisella adeliensis]QIW13274.1 hypothetical protein FZC44_01485 [Francisella adeliensis]
MSNNKAKFLLSKKYLNVKDIREVLLLHDIDLDIEQIIDWIEQSQKSYIKPRDWTSLDVSNFYHTAKGFQHLTLTDMLNEQKDDFLKANYTKDDETFNNSHLEIAYIFKIADYIANVTEYTECPEHLREYSYKDNIYLEKRVSTYDELASIFYTKSSFIKEYLDSLQDHQPKSATNQDDSYKYSEALNPYNDIIWAFENESKEYEKYKNTITKEVIRDELRINYKKLLSSNEKAEFVADLIMEHYNIPKGNRKK